MRLGLWMIVSIAWGCGPAAAPAGQGGGAPTVSNTAHETAPEDSQAQPPPLERARSVVEEFFAAFGRGDVTGMTGQCALPFYLDRDEIATLDKLSEEFSEAAEKIARHGGLDVLSITAVSDWRAFKDDYAGPETDLSAFVVLAEAEGMGKESMRIFVRMGSDPKIVSIRD